MYQTIEAQSMLKIGDFSKLTQVSIKALRLYDRLGLFKPISVDESTGYRYYSARQLPRLYRLLACKDLGFSLEQIGLMLDASISVSQIEEMLRLKQTELQQHIALEQSRLARVAAKLRQIERENNMSDYEVLLKKVPAMQIASIREILPNYPAISRLYAELYNFLDKNQSKSWGYCGAVWHDTEYKEKDVDGEAFIIIDETIDRDDRVKIYELPSVETMACIVYRGSYNGIDRPYAAMLEWIENNSYKIIAPNREIYIEGGEQLDEESYITEIQFTVAKI
jgi:effector-binding domain-containing protein